MLRGALILLMLKELLYFFSRLVCTLGYSFYPWLILVLIGQVAAPISQLVDKHNCSHFVPLPPRVKIHQEYVDPLKDREHSTDYNKA